MCVRAHAVTQANKPVGQHGPCEHGWCELSTSVFTGREHGSSEPTVRSNLYLLEFAAATVEMSVVGLNNRTHFLIYLSASTSRRYFPGHMRLLGGADLHLHSQQPDTSLCCKTTDMGLVHHMVCLFTSQPKLVLILPTPEGWKAEST